LTPYRAVGNRAPQGEQFRRAILAGLPDIEAMELVEQFFEVGAKLSFTA
jgi:hypothetical protein